MPTALLSLPQSIPPASRDLRARVCAEFQEMPGLRLTLPQAARLFSLDAVECERVLDALVEGGVLSTNGQAFARADIGRFFV